MLGPLNIHRLRQNISEWLVEDMPYGDITSQNIITDKTQTEATLIAKEDGIICGLEVFAMVFGQVDDNVLFDTELSDGDTVMSGDIIGTLSGPLASILMGERLALNLLQRMSGIASMSAAYASEVQDLNVRIVDTRKTTPGLRELEKYAVRTGGCHNHRYSLSDAVMLKDNHIKAVGSITEAVAQVRSAIPHTTTIEVEVETLDGLREALSAGADIIMLDNMSNAMMTDAADIADGRAILEASGNMSLERLRSVAQTGVDIISVGALTHSVKAMDISLKFL